MCHFKEIENGCKSIYTIMVHINKIIIMFERLEHVLSFGHPPYDDKTNGTIETSCVMRESCVCAYACADARTYSWCWGLACNFDMWKLK